MPKPKAQTKDWAIETLRKSYEFHMASLPVNGHYDLLEELTSGTIINHLTAVTLDELKSYIRRVFIKSAPPCFIIRPTYSPAPKQTILQRLLRRFTNA